MTANGTRNGKGGKKNDKELIASVRVICVGLFLCFLSRKKGIHLGCVQCNAMQCAVVSVELLCLEMTLG